jgi:hypothetical protein
MTKAPGHAADLAAEALAGGDDVVVAVGGDGTICEVLQGLHAAGRGALGVVPLGTGNDAARTAGVPLQLEEAVRALRAGHRRRIDLMRAGDRVVLNAIGIGLLGTINVNAMNVKWVRGMGAYLVVAVGTLFKWHCPTIELVNERILYTGPMTILAIHNGVTTGGGFRLCPKAIPDDGELDATLVTGTTIPTRLGAVVDAMRGTWRAAVHEGDPLQAPRPHRRGAARLPLGRQRRLHRSARHALRGPPRRSRSHRSRTAVILKRACQRAEVASHRQRGRYSFVIPWGTRSAFRFCGARACVRQRRGSAGPTLAPRRHVSRPPRARASSSVARPP